MKVAETFNYTEVALYDNTCGETPFDMRKLLLSIKVKNSGLSNGEIELRLTPKEIYEICSFISSGVNFMKGEARK